MELLIGPAKGYIIIGVGHHQPSERNNLESVSSRQSSIQSLYIILAASPLASKGFAPRGIIKSSINYPAVIKMRMDRKFSRKNSKFAKEGVPTFL